MRRNDDADEQICRSVQAVARPFFAVLADSNGTSSRPIGGHPEGKEREKTRTI